VRTRSLEPGGDFDEQRVAGLVAQQVVHQLELVEIDIQHGKLIP
jgi:hypothetical protein